MPTTEKAGDNDLSLSTCNRPALPPGMSKNIGLLLQQRCIDTQLYLQHDMTLAQLAKSIGTNRLYLSQYFSSQDMNYNTYINDLRIKHFVSLYREALDTQRSFTIQQLALESGYRSYSTFNAAFKQSMGMTATEWMRNAGTSES
jgi:AraC-like DNA-binding protein